MLEMRFDRKILLAPRGHGAENLCRRLVQSGRSMNVRRAISLLLILIAADAIACSCAEPDLEKIWADARHVFVAEIETVMPVENKAGTAHAAFRVIEVLKGNPEHVPHLVGAVNHGGTGCRFDFRKGERYLVVTDDSGEMSTCDGSVSLGDAYGLDKGLYGHMRLEYFRAAVVDAEYGNCTYAQVPQIAELRRLRNLDFGDSGWQPVSAVPSERKISFEDEYGQTLDVHYGGCNHLGYSLDLSGVRIDLSNKEVLEIAMTMPERFWASGDYFDFVELIRAGRYEMEQIAGSRIFTVLHPDMHIEIRYEPEQATLSVGYVRTY